MSCNVRLNTKSYLIKKGYIDENMVITNAMFFQENRDLSDFARSKYGLSNPNTLYTWKNISEMKSKAIENEEFFNELQNKFDGNQTNPVKNWVDNRNKQPKTQYQLPQGRELEEFVASEKTIRDLAARMSDKIGIPVRFESDRTKKYKGKLENGIAVVNLAYATLDTPIHEILGHPIIRAIKTSSTKIESWYQDKVKSGEYTEEQADEAIKFYYKSEPDRISLYQNLLKEFEYGKGKEVFDRIKRDYQYKKNAERKAIGGFEFFLNENKYSRYRNTEGEGGGFSYFKNGTSNRITKEEYERALAEANKQNAYTLEEQQEEAIVELLGLYTADRLDKVKDGKLISLLKRLLKEMKQFVRSLLRQREVEIDKLPDNMTLGDLADLLAYSNSKFILPGNEVVYTTPDNQQFKTYAEASKYISDLAKSVENVDLSNVKLDKPLIYKGKEIEKYSVYEGTEAYEPTNQIEIWYKDGTKETLYEDYDFINEVLGGATTDLYQTNNKGFNNIKDFIEKNKEYEQSKEIIEEWKKVNNIQYNPEEIYSRGQEFVSVVGAYSDFDINLMMQNLLSHIEDNEKAGGKFAISAFTKPIDRNIDHLEGGGGKIKFKIYPQSKDILWAANIDVYSGSVWDASEKVNKDKKSELLGVSYTKYPSLDNINAVQPNLASIVDNLNHHHNELGITLTGNNFRLEYDNDIQYSTKKIIDSINSILDQKYGKLVKPEIKKRESYKVYEVVDEYYGEELEPIVIKTFNSEIDAESYAKELNDKEGYKNDEFGLKYRVRENLNTKGIQPTQTNETLKETIETVKLKLQEPSFEVLVTPISKQQYYEALEKSYELSGGIIGEYKKYEIGEFEQDEETYYLDINSNERYKRSPEGYFKEEYKEIPKQKKYDSQALINTRVAKLKEVAKKYPRGLIRSEVITINSISKYYGFEEDDLPFQKLSQEKLNQIQEVFNQNPELSKIGTVEQYDSYLDTIFPDSKVKDIVYHTNTQGRIEFGTRGEKGLFVTPTWELAKTYKPGSYGKRFQLLINSINVLELPELELMKGLKRGNEDTQKYSEEDYTEYVVFEPEQIHILGSKQDIEGFKKWIEAKESIIEDPKTLIPEILPEFQITKDCN
jgi:hypothetical protein